MWEEQRHKEEGHKMKVLKKTTAIKAEQTVEEER